MVSPFGLLKIFLNLTITLSHWKTTSLIDLINVVKLHYFLYKILKF